MKPINKKSSLLKFLALIFPFYFLLSACASTPPERDTPQVTLSHQDSNQDGYQQATNLLFLLDSSNSLNESISTKHTDISKFEREKQLLKRINALLPNKQVNTGLRKFGYGSCSHWKLTKKLQNIQPHSQQQLAQTISQLNCASGGSPVESAIKGANTDLTDSQGNKAIILFSDGNFSPAAAKKEILQLKAQYQQQVCIFPVWVGNNNDLSGLKNMQQINKTLCCGFTEKAEHLESDSALASYLDKIINHFNADIDTDCDGVIDATPDKCPNTPLNTLVDKFGCPADNDHDGVLNDQDRCPSTPEGCVVDKFGCWQIPAILFATDKYNITSNYLPTINKIALTLLKNPQLSLSITGHTDNVFTFQYNKVLSKNRANAVQAFFRKKGISTKRMKVSAKASSEPVKPNTTDAGRKLNRRVELKLIYPQSKIAK